MRSAPLFKRAKLDALLQEVRTREEFADTGLLSRIVAAELSLGVVDATLEPA
jgi:hypothetical protein